MTISPLCLKLSRPTSVVVAAYGNLFLPENVINYPRLGCINVHGSLLPEYRGAAPIQRAIMDGKKVTGVTIMHMDIGLDTGDMISKVEVPIYPDDDFEKLHDRMADAGAKLLVDTIPSIEDGTAKTVSDAGTVGAVCEALGYYGMTDVVPTWYEIALKEKYTRDEDTKEMVDLIRSSASIAFDCVFSQNMSEATSTYFAFNEDNKNIGENITSYVEKQIDKNQNELESLNKTE